MNETIPVSQVPLLEFRNVTKYYGSKKVLDSLSFQLGRGGVIGLLGPNGSGKSTIIKLINRLLVPNSGQILISGMEPSEKTAAMISYLPERECLPDHMKVSSLIAYYRDFFEDFDSVKAKEMMARLGVEENAKLRTLSKGTREKVQLVLAMARRADLYVLDEPIGGVDPAAREFILNAIFANYREGGSILITTHLVTDVQSVMDDVIFMADGKAVLCASVEALRNEHGKTVDELFREVYRC